MVLNQEGIFNKAEKTSNKYNRAKAQEVLETVLLAEGQYEKNSNPKYSQDEFLDELIKREIEGSDVKGDVAIIGDYAFELDRSVPKVGKYLGLAKDVVLPEVDATVNLATDKKSATITITAIEEKNGINKIEIWLLGEMIKEYKYEPARKDEITEPPYTVTQDGKYTIKAYGERWSGKTVKVEGISTVVNFETNGNEEWKKEHSTKVTIPETADKVVSAKYVWLSNLTTPEDDQFPAGQTLKSGDKITGGNETMTGTYYLWIMLERQSGEKVKCRSEGFNFDNEGPEITNITTVKSSSTEITLSVEAEDNQSKITKLEAVCYNAADKNRSLEFEAIKQMKQEITIQYDLESLPNMGIVAYDVAGNYSTVSGDVLHTWDCYIGENIQRVYALSCQDYVFNTLYSKGTNGVNKKLWEKVEIDQNTGALSGSGRTILANELDEQTVKCDWWVVDSTSQATLFPGTIFSDASSGYFGDGYIYQPKQFNLPTKSEPSGWRLVDSLPYFPYWLRI